MSGRLDSEIQLDTNIKKQLSVMPDIITEYYYHLISSGKSYNTAKTYIERLNKFLEFTFDDEYTSDFYKNIKAVDINKYISSLRTKTGEQKKRISDSYKTVTWSSLNSFFEFLVPEHLKSNPVSNTCRPKMKDEPDVTFLTKEEVGKVLSNVHTKANERMVNRDLCILKLGFATGLRVSAIAHIDIADVDFNNNRIRVIEKGDREYYVLIGENLKNQISDWINDRNKYFKNVKTDALFVSQESSRISTRTINELIKKYTDVVDKRVTPHVMRHTCATNLYEATGDIYLTSKQLHHKNVSTTQRYAELSNEKQKHAASILDNLI